MTKEVLQQALEALEPFSTPNWAGAGVDKANEAIAAVREALAQPVQPVQEPVAWMNPSWIDPDTRGWQSDSFESIPIEGWLPLYTTSAQRPWVGLTDEELHDICNSYYYSDKELVKLIEAKLKEKNT